MDDGVMMRPDISSESGFSLVETLVSVGVLTTGVLGAAAVLASGMRNLSSTPSDVIVTQKANQAIETVFAGRDSHRLTWAQINNVSAGGVFLDGPQSVTLAGNDGLVDTADDGAVETIDMGSGQTLSLANYTREIKIRDVASENGQLRTVTVTITYEDGPIRRSYVLSSLISAYS